jgi:geranylgeranyl diphosphate synthase, type II
MNEQTMANIQQALRDNLPLASAPGAEQLNDAVRYAVLNGGKRMRPLLCLLGSRLAGVTDDRALPLACAVEYLHSASLIFDDLPSMDDALERRGLPPVHERHGEGVAVLAGLALMNHCYALLARAANPRALLELAAGCIGHRGMIAGQTIDLAADAARRDDTRGAHYLKTTALFRLSLTAGAVGEGANSADIAALECFGEGLGEAYQLLDDAQDVATDAAKDAAHGLGESADSAGMLRAQAAAALERALADLAAHFAGRPEVHELRRFGEQLFAVATQRQEA